MLQVKEVRDQVYLVKMNSSYELAMLFLRYQETYESVFDCYRDKKFTLAEYMSTYAMHQKKKAFLYTSDWSGFNLPVEVIKEVHDRGIDDPNHYDALMLGIYDMIKAKCKGAPAYLIGVSRKRSTEVLRHELAHSMWHVFPDYKRELLEMYPKFGPQVIACTDILHEMMYPHKTIPDEIQAYCSEDEIYHRFMPIPDIADFTMAVREIYRKHNEVFMRGMK